MKNVSKILGLTLALSALVLSGCKKKPVRGQSTLPRTGPSNTVDPFAVAVQADPQGTLEVRDPNAGTPVDENKSVVAPIYFALDRAAVSPAERPKLQAAVKWLADNADKNLILIGHCDWRGTSEYNLGLGDRRTNAVKKFLESLGVDSNRLETLSKGSTEAKQSGGEAEWAKDRRVDFIVLRK